MIIPREFIQDLYYLWDIYSRYTNDRSKDNLDIYLYNLMRGLKEVKYNGQTKTEFDKNYKRVRDIVDKSNGDVNRMIYLSQSQAAKITDEWKAINRAMAAKEMNQEDIFEVFFQRAYELGSVTKQEYREYKLEKLGI